MRGRNQVRSLIENVKLTALSNLKGNATLWLKIVFLNQDKTTCRNLYFKFDTEQNQGKMNTKLRVTNQMQA